MLENNLLDNNINTIDIRKDCPYCKMNLPIFEFEDHILNHEFAQNNNGNHSNNINGYGMHPKNSFNNNQFKKEKIPEVFETLKTKIGNLFNPMNDNNICEEDNNINNNIDNNKNNNINNTITYNNNNINNIRNNIEEEKDNNNNTKENISSMISNKFDSINNNINDKIKPVFNKVSNFFRDIIKPKSDNSSDGNNSSDEESILNIIRFRRHRRRSLSDDNENDDDNDNENNSNNNNRDLYIDDLLRDDDDLLFEKEDTQEILRYIPTSIVKEVKRTNDNNKCVICLSEFQVGEKESLLPCLHIFHSECIEKWIGEKKWCPVCKYDISLKSLLEENNY